ncbi:MAG: tetrahydrofolate synthase [Treponema sp.]|jgi:dihydrofolate synthase/folylpolyglutamate synthase|nr:tetrahydrofolate synthase [Treponema sp.]
MDSSTPFKSSAEVYEWIEGFINLERDLDSRPMKLENMKKLAALAGNPENCAQAVHIAGSKGKGSVSAMTASILKAAGYKTASYASPHVRDFRERITLGNNFFDEGLYALAGNELRRTAGLCIDGGNHTPSFFELFTLWFFLCSRFSDSEVMALETGLGGRLDATNIVDPLVSVITVIEKEHTKILGDTIEKIAAEKAGIIKTGKPLVLAEQKAEALEVFRQKAKETQSPFYYFPDIAGISGLRIDRNGSSFDLNLRHPLFETEIKNLNIPVPGEVQVKNAGLAALAVKTVFPGISEEAIRKGLGCFSLPARFEKLNDDPVLIIDGAHTALSVGECIRTFTELYGTGGICIFGCAADKDADTIASLAVPCFSKIIVTTPGSFKRSYPAEAYEIFCRFASQNKPGAEILLVTDTKEACKLALETGKAHGLPILGTGSFYLAAEITKEKQQIIL